jgi:hypothetical protein
MWVINALFQFDMATELGHNMTAGFFKEAAFAATRDGLSYAALRSVLPNAAHLQLSADLTLLLPSQFNSATAGALSKSVVAAAADHSSESAVTVVLSQSSRTGDAYPLFWKELIPLILEDYPSSAFLVVLDTDGIPELAATFPTASFRSLPDYDSMAHVIWELSKADVYIGGRFHAATYAMLAGLPSILLPGNTWKVDAWAALASIPAIEYLPAGVALGAKTIWSRAKEVMQRRDSFALRGLPALRKLALRNFPFVDATAHLATEVDEQEIAVQHAWLAFIKRNDRFNASFCERFGLHTGLQQ